MQQNKRSDEAQTIGSGTSSLKVPRASIMSQTYTHCKSGSTVAIHPYGATLISYQTKQTEHLFVSDLAKLDGSKPIRGGVPLVFPIFGPPPSGSTMPQHGFARRNLWEYLESSDEAQAATVTFQLELANVKEGLGDEEWKSGTYNCKLLYVVEFNDTSLSTTLTMQNTGKVAFPIQALLHTYYKIHNGKALDGSLCYVKGLQGYTNTDKVTKETPYLWTNDTITISSETDRVYSSDKEEGFNVEIGVGNGKTVELTAKGTVDGKTVPVSCVVWNPHTEKAAAMSDFSNSQYNDMLCVEPGILGQHTLPPGKEAALTQTIVPL